MCIDMTSKPNFLIIVTDDQGYGDLTAFSHHAPDVQTPNMDRLAERLQELYKAWSEEVD